MHSVRRSGPRNRKKTGNWTEPDRLGPDRRLRLRAFRMTQPIWTKPVAYVILLLNTDILSQFWNETVQKCLSYGQNDMLQQHPTLFNISKLHFWAVKKFYHHKNFMVGYYTLYIMIYNWFYVQKTVKIFVLISFNLLRPNFTEMRFGPVWTGFLRSGPVFWVLP